MPRSDGPGDTRPTPAANRPPILAMIRKFSKPLLRFPAKWANAVSDWLMGLCSDGSITILNSATPSNGVPKISVNPSWIANQIAGLSDRERTAPAALAATESTSLAPSDETPTKSADRWSYGTSQKADGTSDDTANKRRGCTFDVVTRVRRIDLVDYLFFRTVTVSPLGVIVSVSPENKCVACLDTSYQ